MSVVVVVVRFSRWDIFLSPQSFGSQGEGRGENKKEIGEGDRIWGQRCLEDCTERGEDGGTFGFRSALSYSVLDSDPLELFALAIALALCFYISIYLFMKIATELLSELQTIR